MRTTAATGTAVRGYVNILREKTQAAYVVADFAKDVTAFGGDRTIDGNIGVRVDPHRHRGQRLQRASSPPTTPAGGTTCSSTPTSLVYRPGELLRHFRRHLSGRRQPHLQHGPAQPEHPLQVQRPMAVPELRGRPGPAPSGLQPARRLWLAERQLRHHAGHQRRLYGHQ